MNAGDNLELRIKDMSYPGDKMLPEFKVIDHHMIVTSGNMVNVMFEMNRIFFFYIYTMFIPSLCVVICAELTLFVNEVP